MAGEGFALAREELVRTLTAYSGVTTADGAAGATSLIDSALAGKNDFLKGKSILIMSGDAQYETSGITAFYPTADGVHVAGEITVATPFSAQIVAGVSFRVLNVLPESVHISSGQVQIMGWDYESGEWRNVRVTGSGEIAIHVTVADIVTAKISGQSVVVTSGQVDVYMMSGEAVAKVSGQAIKISGEAVKISGETVELQSGTGPILASIKGYDLLSGEWRPIVVNESGELAIHITVADIVTAKISGETVKISGEAVEISGEAVRISGETVIAKVSGETVIAKISGEAVKISGETVSIETPTMVKTGPIQIVTHSGGGQVLYSGAVKSALVKAVAANSGMIAVGGSGDRPWYEDVCSGQGLVLDGGEAVSLDIDNFDAVYVVAEVSGDQVSFIGVN